ncbi:hypothetical protein [Leifsonia sp. SIMBA_070]|uniref:hypothetical protein n=1 Tax=Leifsonia sp. SIMBA_070 TaxID=3085810 RepID=UPI00397DC360
MKTVSTRSASFLTGSAIAEAVQHYGLALARKGDVDVVDIPVIRDDGGSGRASFIVGWLMDATTEAAVTDHPELIDSETVADLRLRAELLVMPKAEPFSIADLAGDWPDLDMDFTPK